MAVAEWGLRCGGLSEVFVLKAGRLAGVCVVPPPDGESCDTGQHRGIAPRQPRCRGQGAQPEEQWFAVGDLRGMGRLVTRGMRIWEAPGSQGSH